MAITANKNLLNVVVRLLNGSVSRIIGTTETGYKIEGVAKQVPMEHLVRRGNLLVQIDPATLKDLPKEQTYLMTDGYLHIHSRDAMRRIKKGETVDIAPAKTEFKRVTEKVVRRKPVAKPAKEKAEAKKVVEPKKPAAKSKPDLEVKPAAKEIKVSRKTSTKSKPTVRSTPVDRSAETQRTLFLVIQHARTNLKAWKEFKGILAQTFYANVKNPDIKDIPDTANEIVEKFGLPKVRKALSALSEHFNRRNAELSLPRHLRAFLKDGKMTLNKTQIRAVVAALAPTIHPSMLNDVINIYFSGDFTLNKVPVRGSKKVEGGN